jgi:hypothetical protein
MERARAVPNKKPENDKVRTRVEDLNREMMFLPQEERRRRWMEYYTRLLELKDSDGSS